MGLLTACIFSAHSAIDRVQHASSATTRMELPTICGRTHASAGTEYSSHIHRCVHVPERSVLRSGLENHLNVVVVNIGHEATYAAL